VYPLHKKDNVFFISILYPLLSEEFTSELSIMNSLLFIWNLNLNDGTYNTIIIKMSMRRANMVSPY